MPRYAVHIVEEPEADLIVEVDFAWALDVIGHDVYLMDYVQEIEEGIFILDLEADLMGQQLRDFQDALEWMDGTESCKVSIECLDWH